MIPTCTICFDEISSEDLFLIQDCEHSFCKSCVGQYCNMKLAEVAGLYHKVTLLKAEKKGVYCLELLRTYGVRCPAHNCSTVLLPGEFTPLASKDALQRFDRFIEYHQELLQRLQANLNAENVNTEKEIHCPGCNSKDVRKSKRQRMKCNQCGIPFCSGCSKKHSRSMTCQQYVEFLREEARREEERRRAEEEAKLNKTYMENPIRPCPCCAILVQRNGGCNFMTCRCGQYFCNICGTPLDRTKTSSHWDGNPYGSVCRGKKDASPIL